MGINKLFITLKSIRKSVNLSKYTGNAIGVDIYCWIHRAFYCLKSLKVSGLWSQDFEKFSRSDSFLYFIESRVRLLESFGIQALFVFDVNN